MRGVALACLCACAACGVDEVDLTGTYLVSSQVASEPCGSDMPVAAPVVALRFEKLTAYGTNYFSYERCTDAAAMSCSSSFASSLGEPIDGGWRGTLTSSGGGVSTMCTIAYVEQVARLDGATLALDVTSYADVVENTPQLCSPDEAERRGTTMPCTRHERIEAARR